MSLIESLAQPYEITLPPQSVDFICRQATYFQDDITIEVEHRLARSIVIESQKLLLRDCVITKPDIQVGSTAIKSYLNCTDDTAMQVMLAEAAQVPVLAAWNGGHASTVLPANGYHWRLDGSTTPEIKNSEFPNPHTDTKKISEINHTFEDMAGHDGAYIFYNKGVGWDHVLFKGPDIREASPLNVEDAYVSGRILDASVIVRPPLAYKMLRAIDVLATLREHRNQRSVEDMYGAARNQLSNLVPRLR